LRRYPTNEGGATYHVTEWLPDTAEAGRKFFRGIGFQGLGNVEFKLDRRDGELKLIECNARFTAAQALVTRAGVDTAWIAYCSATGRELPRVTRYREQVCMWNPEPDYRAFRELRQAGALTTWSWVRSLARRKITPYSDWNDPWPAALKLWELVRIGLAKPFVVFQQLLRVLMRRISQRPA
jgi:D-aspartate ligase